MIKLMTLAAIAASAAIPMTASAGTTITPEIGGVKWKIFLDGSKVRLDGCEKTTASVFDAANIPWTFEYDGTTYTMNEIESKALYNKNFFTGTVSFPASITWIGVQAFDGCSITGFIWGCSYTQIPNWMFSCDTINMESIVLPSTITSIGQGALAKTKTHGCWIRGAATVNGNNTFNTSSALKVILASPNTTLMANTGTGGSMLTATGCTLFVPKAGWNGLVPGGIDTRLFLYGAGEDLNLEINESQSTITATIGDANGTGAAALQAVLDNAGRFKALFGLDTRIAVTNSLSGTVTVTDDALQNATFVTYVTFTANTQAQLDSTLAAYPAAMPIVIDATGATRTINVPAGRNVAVLVPGGGMYGPTRMGLTILVK